MSEIYTVTVSGPKEGNLQRRGLIFKKKFLPIITQLLKPDFCGNICEIGAGMGHKFDALKQQFPRAQLTGIEPSSQMRSLAESRGISLLPGSLDSTTLPDSSQDVVCLFQMWHHIALSDYEKCLKELDRITKSGGIVLLLDTFAPEISEPPTIQILFKTLNRFYAVLSQFPVESLQKRFLHAVHSLFFGKIYNATNLGYFSPTASNTQLFFDSQGFVHLPGVSYKFGLSQLYGFQKK